MREFAIIGGGIGGCSAAALLNHAKKDVVLFEKEPYLGGCASTFAHRGYRYNAGATTISGNSEGRVLKKLFDHIGATVDLIETDPAIIIIQKDRIIPRYRNKEKFLEALQRAYPHPKHAEFWELIHTIATEFYGYEGYYYSNGSFLKKLSSLCSFTPVLMKFWKYLMEDAKSFFNRFYGEIDPDYREFLDAQILIVAQAKSESVNLLTAALALGYTFDACHYPLGGMGRVCESLTENIGDIRLSSEIQSIETLDDGYKLTTKKDTIYARNIVLGSSIFESKNMFKDDNIKQYYQRFTPLNNHQSAFVVYLSIPQNRELSHHYQLISKEIFPHTLSNSLFVSVSDPDDALLSLKNTLSITASIHTDSRFWMGLDENSYRIQKEELHALLLTWICDTLCIDKSSIVQSFAATPKTFGHYLNRTQLGGIAMTKNHLLPFLPANDTPIPGLYQVGDTSFAAQGWPGVVMGSYNLMKVLNV